MRKRVNWEGVFPAVTTQFRDDLSLDIDATARVMEGLIRDGVSGLGVGHGQAGDRSDHVGCVRGSVVDAFAYNFRALVPWDCVYDRSATSHAVNLFDMASKYADVATGAEILEKLRPLAQPAAQRKLG